MHFLLFFVVILYCGSSDGLTSTKIKYLPNGQVGGYELVINNTVHPAISPLPRDRVSKIVKHTSSVGRTFTTVNEQVIGQNSYLNVHSILNEQNQQPLRLKYPLKNVLMVPSVRYVNGIPENVKLRFAQIGPYAALIVPTNNLESSASNSEYPVPPEIKESVRTYIEVQEPPSTVPLTSPKTKTGYAYAPPTYDNPSSIAIPSASLNENSLKPQKTGDYIYSAAVTRSEAKSSLPDLGKASNNGFVIRVVNPSKGYPNSQDSGNKFQEFFVPSSSDNLDREEHDKMVANPLKYSGSTGPSTSQFREVYNKNYPDAIPSTIEPNHPLNDVPKEESQANQSHGSTYLKESSTTTTEPSGPYEPESTDRPFEGDVRIGQESGLQNEQYQTSWSLTKTQGPGKGYGPYEGPSSGQPEFSGVSRVADLKIPSGGVETNTQLPDVDQKAGITESSNFSSSSQRSNDSISKESEEQNIYEPSIKALPSVDSKLETYNKAVMHDVRVTEELDLAKADSTTQLPMDNVPGINLRYSTNTMQYSNDVGSTQQSQGNFDEKEVQVPNAGPESNDASNESPQFQDELLSSLSKDKSMEVAVDSSPIRGKVEEKIQGESPSITPAHSAGNIKQTSQGLPSSISSGSEEQSKQSQYPTAGTLSHGSLPLADVNSFSRANPLTTVEQNTPGEPALVYADQQLGGFQRQEETQVFNAANTNLGLVALGDEENRQLFENEKFKQFIQNPSLTTQLKFISPDGQTAAVLTSTGSSAKVEVPSSASLRGQLKGNIVIPKTIIPLHIQGSSPIGYTGIGSEARSQVPEYSLRGTTIPLSWHQYNGFERNIHKPSAVPSVYFNHLQQINVIGGTAKDFRPAFGVNSFPATNTADASDENSTQLDSNSNQTFQRLQTFDTGESHLEQKNASNENGRKEFSGSDSTLRSQFPSHNVQHIVERGKAAKEQSSTHFIEDTSISSKSNYKEEGQVGEPQINIVPAPGSIPDAALFSPNGHTAKGSLPVFTGKTVLHGEVPTGFPRSSYGVPAEYFIPSPNGIRHPIDLQAGTLPSLYNKNDFVSTSGGFDPISAAAVAAAAVAADSEHFNHFEPSTIDTKQALGSLNLRHHQFEPATEDTRSKGLTGTLHPLTDAAVPPSAAVVVVDAQGPANRNELRLANSDEDRSSFEYRDRSGYMVGGRNIEPSADGTERPKSTPFQLSEEEHRKFVEGRLLSQLQKDFTSTPATSNYRAEELGRYSHVNVPLTSGIRPKPASPSSIEGPTESRIAEDIGETQAEDQIAFPGPSKARINMSPQTVALDDTYAVPQLTPPLTHSQYPDQRMASQPPRGPHIEGLLETLDELVADAKTA